MLQAARVPDCPEEYWAQFPKDVVSRLRWNTAAKPAGEPRWFPRLAWGLATVAVCLVAGIIVGRWQGQRESGSYALLQNQKVITEMLSLFPNQVRAIMQDEHGVSLMLSDEANLPPSPPLWVKVCDGKHCSAAVTFSGQEIQLAGRKIMVLADAHGGVLLVGNDFVWSSEEPGSTKTRLKIETRNLGGVTL